MQATFPAYCEYVSVPASSSALALTSPGGSGAIGDVLMRLVVNVTTSATAAVSIQDGAGSAITLVPNSTPIGVYSVLIGAKTLAGPWKVTTGAGSTVLAVGQFT